ncbi:MAG: response regulator transcription factor [Oscillospiraceae bacterium]|nr:response regulator transcription factor [Oscillospiraceae bacterium]
MDINVFIVDDDKSVTDSLEYLILDWADQHHQNVKFQIKNTLKGVDPLSVLPYDLVILDVLIGETNGIEFAKTLRELGCDATIAFISSYNMYALEGYVAHAISYIMKPIEQNQLFSVLDETEKRVGDFNSKTICFPFRSGYRFISTRSILYISCFGKYTDVVLHDKTERFSVRIKDIEAQLPGTSLIRCHRSFIVNTNYVRRISSNMLELEGTADLVPIGRLYSDKLKQKLFGLEGGNI